MCFGPLERYALWLECVEVVENGLEEGEFGWEFGEFGVMPLMTSVMDLKFE